MLSSKSSVPLADARTDPYRPMTWKPQEPVSAMAEAATKKYEAYRQRFSINLHDLVQRAHEKAVKVLQEGEEA